MARIIEPGRVFKDDAGNILSGGTVTFYTTSTTTLKATYSDSSLATQNPNPISIGSDGRLPVEVFGSGSYTVRVADSSGTTIWSEDDVTGEILYETGTFTPTMTFATPGDLTVSYTTQKGSYWLLGSLAYFSMTLAATPTFTTSSGAFRITGLPYEAYTQTDVYIFPLRLLGSGITWPISTGDVVAFMRDTEQWIEIATQKSASLGQNLAASDFTTAVAFTAHITGFYPIA